MLKLIDACGKKIFPRTILSRSINRKKGPHPIVSQLPPINPWKGKDELYIPFVPSKMSKSFPMPEKVSLQNSFKKNFHYTLTYSHDLQFWSKNYYKHNFLWNNNRNLHPNIPKRKFRLSLPNHRPRRFCNFILRSGKLEQCQKQFPQSRVEKVTCDNVPIAHKTFSYKYNCETRDVKREYKATENHPTRANGFPISRNSHFQPRAAIKPRKVALRKERWPTW